MSGSNMIGKICKWNDVRGNKEFDGSLEFNMLQEELNEFTYAYLKTINDKFPKDTLEFDEAGELTLESNKLIVDYMESEEGVNAYRVNQLDALLDLAFVAMGSVYKMLGSEDLTESAMDAVIAANNRKGTEKVDGKIKKPDDFVGPEKDLLELYLDRVTLT